LGNLQWISGLCESHLLPGALLMNDHQKFLCQNQYLIPQTTESAITRNLDVAQPLNIPIAHGEGRYYADEQTLLSLKQNNQILFKYCDADGNINATSNPNGSIENIAGICNVRKKCIWNDAASGTFF
jgi:phosphoribosylformylglycinamidine (FGAM) synthase-like amidotransferase family enzyme